MTREELLELADERESAGQTEMAAHLRMMAERATDEPEAVAPGSPATAAGVPSVAVVPQGRPSPLDEPQPVRTGAQRVFVEPRPTYPFIQPEFPVGRQYDITDQAGRTYSSLNDFIEKRSLELQVMGYSPELASQEALKEARELGAMRGDVRGRQVTTGEGGVLDFIPPFRETRIREVAERDPQDPSKTRYVQKYRDPDTGELTDPTEFQLVRESFARQPVLTPDQAEQIRQQKAFERQEAFRSAGGMILDEDSQRVLEERIVNDTQPMVSGILSSLDTEMGRTIETPFAATLRGMGAVPTLINEAVMQYTPLFWEMDDQGNPVNPNEAAYVIHKTLRDLHRRAGLNEEEIDRALTGAMGDPNRPGSGTSVDVFGGLPMPFQGIQRSKPTSVDPTGRRVAAMAGSFPARYAQSMAMGRSLGDELMSMPAYVRDFTEQNQWEAQPGYGVLSEDYLQLENDESTLPFWLGIAAEIPYSFGPGYATTGTVRAGARGAVRAARALKVGAQARQMPKAAKVAEVAEKAAYITGNPIEAAKRSRNIRLAQEIAEGKVEGLDEIDILTDLNSANRVVGESVAEEVIGPYSMLARVVSASEDPVTVGELLAVGTNSAAARRILHDAGVLNAAPDTVLTTTQRAQVLKGVNQYTISAYSGVVQDILATPGLDDVAKAQRIVEQFEAGGVRMRDWPYTLGLTELLDIADGKGGDLARAVEPLLTSNGGALTIQARKPVVATLHETGAQIVGAARTDEVVRARGPVGQIMNRRLGDKAFNRQTLREAPEEVHRAASAAGGRAVEATLENAMPNNMVFVTPTLMAPRRLLTPQVFDDVARAMDEVPFTASAGPVVDGKTATVFTYTDSVKATDAFIDAVGRGNIERAPMMYSIAKRLEDGAPLTATEHKIVQDALQTKAYEQALKGAGREALFAGEQIDRAQRAGVNIGLETAPQARVPRQQGAIGSALPFGYIYSDVSNLIGEVGGRKVAQLTRNVARKFDDSIEKPQIEFRQQTPAAIQLMESNTRRELGAIGDNFQREVRDAATAAQGTGRNRFEVAYNQVINKRVNKVVTEATDAVDREAERLVRELNISPEEAYYYVAYQRGSGRNVTGLGELARREGIPQNIAQIARDREATIAMDKAWRNILRQFFGDDVYDTSIDAIAPRFILQPEFARAPGLPEVPTAYRPITTGQLREVIDDIRTAQPQLKGRGLSRSQFLGALGSPSRDAIFDTLGGWALGVDRQAVVTNAARRLRETDPGAIVDLAPSLASVRPARMFREASLPGTSRRGVLTALERLGARAQEGQTQVEAATEAAARFQRDPNLQAVLTRARDANGNFKVGRSGTFELAENGQFMGELDRLSANLNRNIDPETKMRLAQQIVDEMVRTGRPVPDTQAMVRIWDDATQLNLREFQKQAATESIQKTLRGMDLRVREYAQTSGVDIDAIEMDALLTAQQRGFMGLAGGQGDLMPVLREVFGNDADALLYLQVRKAREAGYSDDFIVSTIRQTVVEKAVGTYVSPLVDEINASVRAGGMVPGQTADLANLQKGIETIDLSDPSLMVMGDQWMSAMRSLQQAAAEGRLAQNVETLQRRDALARGLSKDLPPGERSRAMAEYAGGLLKDTAATTRRTAAGGLLAGGLGVYVYETDKDVPVPYVVPTPNVRYLGMNLITAPVLALTTVGAAGAVRMARGQGIGSQSREVARQLNNITGKPLINANRSIPREAVAFKSVDGRVWTQGELDDAIARNNILISRGQVEFNDAFMSDVLRDAKLLQDATPAGPFRDYLRQLDPTRTNIMQFVANATDKAFRENMFATALRNGMPEEQAAQLARAVVLDYGRVPPFVRNHLNRYALFLSFRASNTIETMEMLARDPATFARMVNTMDNQQQASNAGLLGPDYARTRNILSKEFVFDNAAGAALYGPVIPSVEAYNDMLNLAAYGAQLGAENNEELERAIVAASEENLIPVLTTAIDASFRKGKRPTDPGYKVPTWVVEWAINNGPDTTWPYLKDQFGIVPLDPQDPKDRDKLTPGRARAIDPQRPERGETEYKFKSQEDMDRFLFALMTMTYLGMRRSTEDMNNLGMTYDRSDYLNPGKRGINPTFGQLTGVSTPITIPDPSKVTFRVLAEEEKRIKGREKVAPE